MEHNISQLNIEKIKNREAETTDDTTKNSLIEAKENLQRAMVKNQSNVKESKVSFDKKKSDLEESRENYKLLELIGEVAGLLKLEGHGHPCRSLLETLLLTFTGNDIEKRKAVFEILDEFCDKLKVFDLEDLESLSKIFRELFIPRKLRELMVNSTNIEAGSVIIGEGGFGLVTEGLLRKSGGTYQTVAIKSSLREENTSLLEMEARVLSQLNHKNVIKLVAYHKNPVRIAFEHMVLGSLNDVIEQQDLSNEQLFNMLRDVICGMEYIASQKIVHRDLATRNIFVSSIFECKIGDFGSCCYIDDCNGTYEDKTEKVFLDLNVPPEAKITQIFSMKTDVWAMGLLIWDAFIRASSKSSMPLFCFELVEAYTIFSNTGQLPMPSRCPADIYLYVREKLMHDDPSQRPTFAEINQKFSKFNKAGSRSYAVTS